VTCDWSDAPPRSHCGVAALKRRAAALGFEIKLTSGLTPIIQQLPLAAHVCHSKYDISVL